MSPVFRYQVRQGREACRKSGKIWPWCLSFIPECYLLLSRKHINGTTPLTAKIAVWPLIPHTAFLIPPQFSLDALVVGTAYFQSNGCTAYITIYQHAAYNPCEILSHYTQTNRQQQPHHACEITDKVSDARQIGVWVACTKILLKTGLRAPRSCKTS